MRVDFFIYLPPRKAQVVELVDTLVSGTSVRKDVQVRVLFWVLLQKEIERNVLILICCVFLFSVFSPHLKYVLQRITDDYFVY